MVNKIEVLALIPARGGSKGILRKNIRDFAGFPLIAYSIIAAKQAELVTRVIVSTDDEEIAAIARQYGAETPFIRPAELAEDITLDLPVMQHTLNWLHENEGYQPEIVVWLRPTSPIRPKSCVDDAIRLLLDNPQADSVRGVVPAGQNPYKMWRIDEHSGVMNPLIGVEGIAEPYNAPRQSLPDVYWQTGHIDAIRASVILEKNSPTGNPILPLFIDPSFTVDIDQPSDWITAERLVKEGGLSMVDPANHRRQFPKNVRLVVFDFDGVMTDDRVWVDASGNEMVAANRSDGMGLVLLREKTDIEAMVVSRETNLVVSARCKKLSLPVHQSVTEKGEALREIMRAKSLQPQQVIFMGNDVNDIPGFEAVGYTVAPADAHPQVLRMADLVLTNNGGHGAVRELCDILMINHQRKS